MSEPLSITVLLGGPSAEREVSLRSGRAIAGALRSLGHVVAELDPVRPDWKLEPGTDLVFLALHGTYGEDGTVQRQLEQLGVPFTGCDSESSRIAFDKVLTKERCLDAGAHTAVPCVSGEPGPLAGRLGAAGRSEAGSTGVQRRSEVCQQAGGIPGRTGGGVPV